MTTFIYCSLGLCIYWLTTLNAYARSGLVCQVHQPSYKSLILPLSVGTWSALLYSFKPSSFRVLAGWYTDIPVSYNKSNAYFFWDKKIPFLDLETSILRKYFRGLRSFIWNYFDKYSCSSFFSSTSFPVTTMTSIYTMRAVILPCRFFKNKVWS